MPTTTTIYQSASTRRQAVALLGWLREGDPDAGVGDMIELVLASALNARGIVPSLPGRHAAGRPSSVAPVTALSRDRLNVRGGRRTVALLSQAREAISGSTSAMWAGAVAELYWSITAPVTDEELGPQAGAWVAQGPCGPLEAVA
jgi:hypothetical protein